MGASLPMAGMGSTSDLFVAYPVGGVFAPLWNSSTARFIMDLPQHVAIPEGGGIEPRYRGCPVCFSNHTSHSGPHRRLLDQGREAPLALGEGLICCEFDGTGLILIPWLSGWFQSGSIHGHGGCFPIIGTERGGRETLLVIQVATRRVGPTVAHRHRL